MEEIENVLEAFSSKLSTENDAYTNYRISQYKSNDHACLDQEARRKLYLDRQRSERESAIDQKRGILEAVKASEDEDASSSNVYKPSTHVPGFTHKKNDLANVLMLSEWMIEPPEDLQDKWLVLACPKGLRVLLIASKGAAKTYNKSGRPHKTWQCGLPGGSDGLGEFQKTTILDCVWNEYTQSFYVLDVLMWSNMTVTDCDMDFRDNWMKSKFSEDLSYGVISNNNHYPLHLVPKFNCDKQTFNEFMSIWPPFPNNDPPIDGFLFYHKEAHYVAGTTPLNVWLYPYMINELLGEGICVHENYMNMKPPTYVDQKTFIKAFEEKTESKKKYKHIYDKKLCFKGLAKPIANVSADGNQQVIIFGAQQGSPKLGKKNNRRRKNKNRQMETDLNSSRASSCDKMDQIDAVKCGDADSAVSSMDDSVLEDIASCHNDSGIKSDDMM